MWRLDDQTEPPMSPPVVWIGVTVFQLSEPEVTVEQETHDKAAREAKALHCLGHMSRLNSREHSTTLRICLIGLGANTVYVPKARSDKASETLIDNLSFRWTIRLLLLELMYNKGPL